jgi:hypothetical protein
MLSGIGTLFFAILALLTYCQWAHRETFLADRERAIEILRIIVQAEQRIKEIRSPIPTAGELFEAEQKFGQSTPKSQITNTADDASNKTITAQIIIDRIFHDSEIWKELFNCVATAEAVFGTKLRDELMKIVTLRQKIYAAAMTYPRAEETKFSHELEAVFWERANMIAGKPVDEISAQLDNIKTETRIMLREYIKS